MSCGEIVTRPGRLLRWLEAFPAPSPTGRALRQGVAGVLVAGLTLAAGACASHGGTSQRAGAPAATKGALRPTQTVAYVDGAPVTSQELGWAMTTERPEVFAYFARRYSARDSATFWTSSFHGQVPLAVLKRGALHDMVVTKLQQRLLVDHHIAPAFDFASFQAQYRQFEVQRKVQARKGQPVYGPTDYSESGYGGRSCPAVCADGTDAQPARPLSVLVFSGRRSEGSQSTGRGIGVVRVTGRCG